MCGIFGYTGRTHSPTRLLLHGLERLEYRGYDSAGIVVGNQQGEVTARKAVGSVKHLSDRLVHDDDMGWSYGIAHTRRATHGGVTEENCHPHASNSKRFWVVHNGIIENYMKLKSDLQEKGYAFYSETDTEVIVNLLEEHREDNLVTTVQKVSKLIRGAYALLVVDRTSPDQMLGIRLGSPLLLGYDERDGYYFSSDSQALTGYAEKIIFLEDGDVAHIARGDYVIMSGGKPVVRDVEELDQEALVASKGTFKHFMLKEIFEQPNIIRRIYKGRVDFDTGQLTADAFRYLKHRNFKRFVFVACGTSSYASVLGAQWIEHYLGFDAKVIIGSEFENNQVRVGDEVLHVFVSQSGETADSIQALKLVRDVGGATFGVVNVVGSTIARMTDAGMFTRAGTEIAVASTKAFVAQLTCIVMLVLSLAKQRGIAFSTYKHLLVELEKLPMMIEAVLGQEEYIRSIATQLAEYKNFFFLGRHFQYPIAQESSLKCKEVSYLHSEAYPTGELKHGPLALIDETVPTIMFMPNDEHFMKNANSLQEIKARKGKVLAISDKRVDSADRQIMIPETLSEMYPFLTVIVGQLLAYYMADELERSIDKPRNLAKSVTVK